MRHNVEIRLDFAQRLRQRRKELGLTQDQVAELAVDRHETISKSTIRNMESERYNLPSKWFSKGRLPIEIIGDVLGVPLGYLLGGFTDEQIRRSCFYEQVLAQKIKLIDNLDREADGLGTSFKLFLANLPYDESSLLQLPLSSYRNERAIAAIFRFERIYCGREMLLVNEPPFIFWDDADVRLWVDNMNLHGSDAETFISEFNKYKAYFRDLAVQGKKTYFAVINRHRFEAKLNCKSRKDARAFLEDMIRFCDLPSFSIALLAPNSSTASLMWASDSQNFHESEVLCKHTVIPESLDDTIAVQIIQSLPGDSRLEYFIAPIYPHRRFLQREKSRIEEAWSLAIDQMEQELGWSLNHRESRTAACKTILKGLLK